MNGRQTCARRGFSLLEVLVALAIFAAAVAVFSKAFVNTLMALDNRVEEGERLDDLRFVRSLIIMEPDLDTFEEGGDVATIDDGQVDWTAEVEPTGLPHLFKVRLNYEFHPAEGDSWSHEETLHLLRPTWSEATEASELTLEVGERIEESRNALDWK